jgi:tellurite resistance protein
MEIPGIHNMRTGALWLVPGILLSIANIAFLAGNGGLIFTGAITIGATYLVVGLVQWVRYTQASPEKKAQIHARVTMAVLIRSMCLVANADGIADEAEIETLGDVCERLSGTRPAPDQVRKVISSLEGAEGEPWELIAGDGRQLPREDKALIAKACYLLMTANGGGNPEEDRMLGQILYGLGISRAQALGDLAAPRQA